MEIVLLPIHMQWLPNDWRPKVVAGDVNGTLTDDNKQNPIGEKGLARVFNEKNILA